MAQRNRTAYLHDVPLGMKQAHDFAVVRARDLHRRFVALDLTQFFEFANRAARLKGSHATAPNITHSHEYNSIAAHPSESLSIHRAAIDNTH